MNGNLSVIFSSCKKTHTLMHILPAEPCVISVIGSGGKSTLLAKAAAGVASRGDRCILATSTHMFPLSDIPLVHTVDELSSELREHSAVCIGELNQAGGKLSAPVDSWTDVADVAAHMGAYLIIEADGSHCLPLKAHAEHEPVVPPQSKQTLLIIGARGFNHPSQNVVHRPELFCELVDADVAQAATPELVAREIGKEIETGHIKPDAILINQVEDKRSLSAAQAFAHALIHQRELPIYTGSLNANCFIHLS